MAESDQVYRFAVGLTADSRSAVYRCWSPHPSHGKSDVYFNMRAMGEEGKLSLHEDRGHVAISKSLAADEKIGDRFMVAWSRVRGGRDSFAPQFELIVPTSELHDGRIDDESIEDVVWLPPAGEDGALQLCLFFSDERLVQSSDSTWTVAHEFTLGAGGCCTIAWQHLEHLPDALRNGIAVQRSQVANGTPKWRIGSAETVSQATRVIAHYRRFESTLGWLEYRR